MILLSTKQSRNLSGHVLYKHDDILQIVTFLDFCFNQKQLSSIFSNSVYEQSPPDKMPLTQIYTCEFCYLKNI